MPNESDPSVACSVYACFWLAAVSTTGPQLEGSGPWQGCLVSSLQETGRRMIGELHAERKWRSLFRTCISDNESCWAGSGARWRLRMSAHYRAGPNL